METGLEELLGSAVKGDGLGWISSIAATFGFTSDRNQRAEIQAALDAMGKQVTQLQGQLEGTYRAVAQDQLTLLGHQTDTTLGRIDHAQGLLGHLAKMPPDDPTLPKYARTIEDYIGAQLFDAPTILHRTLSPGIPLVDNVIKATSKAVAAGTRVFDTRKQAQVEAVHTYFAVYQTELAVLLANYWHSKPDTYSPETIRDSLAQIQSNVAAQRSALKPRLPSGSWMDPATGLMWTFTIEAVSGPAFIQSYLPRSVVSNLDPVGGAPFRNWRLASSDQIARHISEVSGSARAYLNAALGHEDAVRPTTWVFNSLVPEAAGYRAYRDPFYVRLQVFNLDSNQLENLTEPGYQYDNMVPAHSWPSKELDTAAGREWFATKQAAGLLYVRQPAAGEDYWWGAARAGG